LPEVSNNFEAGFKSDLMDRMLRLNGTVFYNTYENQQLTVGRIVNGQPTADLINAQEAVLWGIEYEVVAQLSGGWAVSSTGGYLSGEYTEFTVQDNVYDPITLEESIVTRDLSGLDFGNGGTETSFDVSLLHINELNAGGDVTTSIGYGYKDAVFGSLENNPSSRMKGYWLLDGRMTWNLSNGRTRVSLWGTNLLDRDYVDTMLYQGGDIETGGTNGSLGMLAKYWGNPRRMGLEVTHDF
jgi:iron complex outermembrane receptor protein